MEINDKLLQHHHNQYVFDIYTKNTDRPWIKQFHGAKKVKDLDYVKEFELKGTNAPHDPMNPPRYP